MSTKALKKQLMAAVAMMLVAVIALSGSTFAWFATNTKVTATAMDVTTTVDSNLFIAAGSVSDGVANTTIAADSAFGTILHQPISAKLQPVSSVNGSTFFFTYDAKATGEKQNEDLTLEPYKALSNNTINSNGTDYQGYVDYVLELKAINAKNTNQVVNLTKLNLLYNGVAPTEKAYRVAVFAQETTSAENTAYNALAAAANAIYTIDGAENFTEGDVEDYKAVSATNALSDVEYNADFPTLTVPAGKTSYFKLTFRLWLEGEDTDCSSIKFMSLDKNWELDLAFELADSAANITTIGSTPTTTLSNASNALTAALTVTGKTAATYEFHKVVAGVDTVVQDASTTATYTMNAAGDYYCVIVAADGNTYRTATATYVAPVTP